MPRISSAGTGAASPVTTASLARGGSCNERAGPKARPARKVYGWRLRAPSTAGGGAGLERAGLHCGESRVQLALDVGGGGDGGVVERGDADGIVGGGGLGDGARGG